MDDIQLTKILEQALRDGLYEPDNLYRFDTKLAWDLTNEAHVHGPQRLAVIAAIENHPEIQRILGMQLNSGINGPRLSQESLGKWLLTRANQLGPEVAVAEVRVLLDNGYLDIEEYLAFSGLEISKPITLPNNIDLVPISEIPESTLSISLTDPDWFYFGRNSKGHVIRKSVQILDTFGKKEFHTDPNVAMAAMRIRSRRRPAVISTSTDIPNSRGMMLNVLRVLAAATCTAMFPVAHWDLPALLHRSGIKASV